MEREGRKRSSPTEEMEATQAKRLCSDSDFKSDHVLNEIVSEIDANQAHASTENIEEELVRDMMKSLQQEISSSSSCEEESSSRSYGRHETTVNGESGSPMAEAAVEFNSFNFNFEYIWGAGNDELGIPTSPESDLVESVNEDCFCGCDYNPFCGCDYNPDYGFFEFVLMEREVEQQLLMQNLWRLSNDD